MTSDAHCVRGLAIIVALIALSGGRVAAQPARPAASEPAVYVAPAYAAWALPGYERALRPDTLVVASPPPDRWLGRDKALHAGGSFLLTLSSHYILTVKLDADVDTALPLAAGSTLALGVLKELLDARRPTHAHFSTRDLTADVLGVLLAIGVVVL